MDIGIPFRGSLEYVAFVTIAVYLLNHVYIKRRNTTLHSESFTETTWEQFQNEVLKNVHRLPLPDLVQRKLMDVIKSIHFQMIKLIRLNYLECGIIKLPIKYISTSQGTLNREKVAKALISDNSLNVYERFKVACTYCIEDDIRQLWNQLEESQRKASCTECCYRYLVRFWSNYMRREASSLHAGAASNGSEISGVVDYGNNFDSDDEDDDIGVSNYAEAFKWSAIKANEVATTYFLKKLSQSEKEDMLLHVAEYIISRFSNEVTDNEFPQILSSPEDEFGEIFFLLFSAMDEDQQMDLLARHPCCILCFLAWPYQTEFLQAAKSLRDLGHNSIDVHLLKHLSVKIKNGFTRNSYEEVFWLLWNQMPTKYQLSILSTCTAHHEIFRQLFLEDSTNVNLTLINLSPAEKHCLISSESGNEICHKLICDHPHRIKKWGVLKTFIQECLSSKDTITALEKMLDTVNDPENRRNFSQLLDELSREYDNERK